MRTDRLKNGDKRRETDKRHYRRHSAQEHATTVSRRYSLTRDEAAAVLAATACDLCGRDNGSKRMVVDHCHETGKNRGILCDRCNLALGHFSDDVELMRRAIAYLEASGSGVFSGTMLDDGADC